MERQRMKHLVVGACAGALLFTFVGISFAVGAVGQPSKASVAAVESGLLVPPLTRDELVNGAGQYDSVLSFTRSTQLGLVVAGTAATKDVLVATGQPKKKQQKKKKTHPKRDKTKHTKGSPSKTKTKNKK